ncbi:uncharacterized protein BX663DRAFT_505930 [Cokeromyces recurvatus]|uniref:uncharacterized protein n=1 Tax=Cokeromyces recurvatus TaxID=90255 RepID=UPI00221F85AF|nr:uncharacterized protein BX663DRAFT_505930 [Cokeromyces recurvatus]KAI7903966.1 hypothetical protein BX663DRAFT_505930 [Cokeromyces recurvatus]
MNETTSGSHFFQRVSSIPIIKDAQNMANMTFIGRLALSTAKHAMSMTQPPKYLQDYVKIADDFGCRSLDVIQEKVPILTQPSSEIMYAFVKQPMIDLKVGIYSTLQTVAHPAHVVTQGASKRLGLVVDSFENAVDVYLPLENEVNNENPVGDHQHHHHHQDDVDENQIKRAFNVMGKATHRIGQRVSHSSPKTREEMIKMAENNSYIKKILEQLIFFKDTIIQSMNVYGTAAADRLPVSVTVYVHQTTLFFTQVILKLYNQLGSLKSQSSQAPYWLKQKLEQVLELVYQQLGEIGNEFLRNDISTVDKFKHIAGRIMIPLQSIVSYINTYIESIKHQLNYRVHYFGLNQKIKTQ